MSVCVHNSVRWAQKKKKIERKKNYKKKTNHQENREVDEWFRRDRGERGGSVDDESSRPRCVVEARRSVSAEALKRRGECTTVLAVCAPRRRPSETRQTRRRDTSAREARVPRERPPCRRSLGADRPASDERASNEDRRTTPSGETTRRDRVHTRYARSESTTDPGRPGARRDPQRETLRRAARRGFVIILPRCF